jgi:hypothetical protein
LLPPFSSASLALRRSQLTPSRIEEAWELVALAFTTVAFIAVAFIAVQPYVVG